MAETQAWTPDAFDLFVPPADADVSTYVWTATLLVGLLVVGVPLAAVLIPISVWNLILLSGTIYLGVLLIARTEFVGLESALLVLLTFDIGLTLVNVVQVWYVSLDLLAVDLVALASLGVLAYRGRLWVPSFGDGWRAVAVAAFGVFVCWSFLAAVFGSGPSTTAAGIFAVEQLRYAVVLVLAASIARSASPWAVVYPLVIAIGGHLAVALAQVLNEGTFGLYALGETFLYDPIGSFELGSATIRTGFYAGGFLGHTREFAIVLLMFVPLVIAVAAVRAWRAVPAVVAVAAAVLVIRVADTDAGWASLFLVVGLVAAFGLYLVADRAGTPGRIVIGIGALAVLAVGGYAFLELLAAVRANGVAAIPFFRTRSLEPRIGQSIAAITIAVQYPLFGLGGLNFYLVANEYLVSVNGVHNTLFSHLAATGFVGVAAYLVSIGALLVAALRRVIDSTTENRFLWACLVCAMVGFHAYSMWELTFSWEAASMIFWALAGVVVGTRPERNKWQWAGTSGSSTQQ